MYQDDLRVFVHAGINPKRPIDKQSEDDCLWIRNEFLHHTGRFPKHVVHGHSICTDPRLAPSNRTCLDTGAFKTGILTAGVFDDTYPGPLGFLQSVKSQLAAPVAGEG